MQEKQQQDFAQKGRGEFQRHVMRKLNEIDERTERTEKDIKIMAISQAQFDSDLKALVDSIGQLIAAVEASIASKPEADLSAEDQSVADAAAQVKAELDKLAAPAPVAGGGAAAVPPANPVA